MESNQSGSLLDTSASSPSRNWARGLLWLCALLSWGLGLAWIYSIDEASFLTHCAKDDSFYYFQIARNIARGLGPSFDGEELTNGLQPIWCAVLVPIFAWIEDPSLAARTGCALSLTFYCAAFLLFARLLRPLVGPWPSALACSAALLSEPMHRLGMAGMDFSLNLLLLLLSVAAFLRMGKRDLPLPARVPLLVGTTVGVFCIQRPDTCVIAILLTLPVLMRRGGLRDSALLLAGSLLIALPYLGLSQWAFGAPMPVSGRLKTNTALSVIRETEAGLKGPIETFGFGLRGPTLQPLQALIGGRWSQPLNTHVPASSIALGLMLLLALVLRRRGPPTRQSRNRIVLPILVGAVIHLVIVAIFLFPYVKYGNWYFSPQILAGTMLLAFSLRGLALLLPAAWIRAASGLACLGLLAGAGEYQLSAWSAPSPPADQVERVALEVSQWMRTELGPDARIGIFNAGRVAYYTDACVVNLDGLVNTHQFAEDIWMYTGPEPFSNRFFNYIVDKRLEYMVDVWPAFAEGQMPRARFGPKIAELFEMIRIWPVAQSYDGIKPGSYQLYRFDIEGALALRREFLGSE